MLELCYHVGRCGLKLFSLLVMLLLLTGCGPGVEIGEVTGVVTQGDQPLEQVMVYFMPDPEKGNRGKHSTAVTDAAGRYSLTYSGDHPYEGAAVGWHKVTLEDLVPENFRGAGRPPKSRIPDSMTEPWQTSLQFDVKQGRQTIDIQVPK
jgi:hypothetical protein